MRMIVSRTPTLSLCLFAFACTGTPPDDADESELVQEEVQIAPEIEDLPDAELDPEDLEGTTAEPLACSCVNPPGLKAEDKRQKALGATPHGICGNADHKSGYHREACSLPDSDYSLRGAKNKPANNKHAAAIDIGMDWPASRSWLKWLIAEKRAGRMKGVAEVIGSLNGTSPRYWSDTATPGWPANGDPYTGGGHVKWTHVAIYRSGTNKDHSVLKKWNSSCHRPVCGSARLCCGAGLVCRDPGGGAAARCCPATGPC